MCTSFRARLFRNPLLLAAIVVLASAISLSAHMIKSVDVPGVAAFVSSPTGDTDAPIPLLWQSTSPPLTIDTGLRVACFYVANSSSPDPADPDWPRITSVGFELPAALPVLPCSSH